MKVNEWKISYVRPVVPDEFVQSGYAPLLSFILCQRGIDTLDKVREFTENGASTFLDPYLMKDMDKAVNRIHQAILNKETVAVYGDYDVDGITSTCLLSDYLSSKGCNCENYIPVREDQGYGLKCSAIDELSLKGVKLIITVDCGITAIEETEYARSKGIDVIITDHHECGGNGLPNAIAVIDCKRNDDTYPNRNLAGVGVALKLVSACEGNYKDIIDRYSDLVAIGTVADVMLLTDENRYLVKRGLELINDPSRKNRPGIDALLVNEKGFQQELTASNISFSLAPRLNAAGRIKEAVMAVELLLSTDVNASKKIVQTLDDLNAARKNFGESIWRDALEQLSGTVQDGPIVLYSDKWHQGVIGIVASRIAEKYKLPAVLICFDDENSEDGKGSCRSYGDFNLFNALSSCSDYLIGFGGHALAAGLNIKRSNIHAFSKALRAYYLANKPENTPSTICDIAIYNPQLLDIPGVKNLELLEPYGNGNLKPVMCISGAEVISATNIGKDRNHLKLSVRFKETNLNAIFFSYKQKIDIPVTRGSIIDIAFTPQINSYNDQQQVQLIVIDLKPHTGIELGHEILNGNEDALYFYDDSILQRNQLGNVWRFISSIQSIPANIQDLYSTYLEFNTVNQVKMLSTVVMSFPEFCLALKVFGDENLLESDTDSILGARIASKPSKVQNIEASKILRRLQDIRN